MPDPTLPQDDRVLTPAGSEPYDEDDLVMIFALQHYLFCPRQGTWDGGSFPARERGLSPRHVHQ